MPRTTTACCNGCAAGRISSHLFHNKNSRGSVRGRCGDGADARREREIFSSAHVAPHFPPCVGK